MSRNEEFQKEELQKIQNYLQDSRTNIERLKQGKKPKRKLRFFIKEHQRLFLLISFLLVTTPFLAFINNNPVEIIHPYNDTIVDTIDMIGTNFTTTSGFPVYEMISENTSSELIILNSLTNSMLIESEFVSKEESVLQSIDYLFQIIENDTFRDYNNRTKQMPVFYQFLGIYTLLQAYYALKETSYEFSFNNISKVINSTLNNFIKYSIWPFFYVVSEGTNTTYLAEQAVAITALTTYLLMTDDQDVYDWDLKEVTENMMDRIESRFYIPSTQLFYHQYDHDTYTSSGLSTSQDLMFTSLGLSRMEKYFAGSSFPISSSLIHQKVITELVDMNWLVHETDKIDATILIENQAYFSLVSYLLNLKYVGTEIENATTTHFYTEEGFIADKIASKVTAESCLYGLLTIIAGDWSIVQNSKEIYVEPRPYPTSTEYPTESSSINILFVLVTTMIYLVTLRIRRRIRKQK